MERGLSGYLLTVRIETAVTSPFAAPIFHVETTESTMDDARSLALEGAPFGTAIVADHQSRGRGRGTGRSWLSPAGESLLCTIILPFPSLAAMPRALTLRVGLALALALEGLAPDGPRPSIKWPNDILLGGRKVCGILCESTGKAVLAGFGLNISQKSFPPEIAATATSLRLEGHSSATGEPGTGRTGDPRWAILSLLLSHLKSILEPDADWRPRIEARLYRRGQRIIFLDGMADAGTAVRAVLHGIGEHGELLLIPEGGTEPRAFITGELAFERAREDQRD